MVVCMSKIRWAPHSLQVLSGQMFCHWGRLAAKLNPGDCERHIPNPDCEVPVGSEWQGHVFVGGWAWPTAQGNGCIES